MKIIKQEIQFEESLKQRLEFICEFSKVIPTFLRDVGSTRMYFDVSFLLGGRVNERRKEKMWFIYDSINRTK